MQSDFFPVSTDATATRWDFRPNAQQFRVRLGSSSGKKLKEKLDGTLNPKVAPSDQGSTALSPSVPGDGLETIEIHDRLPEKKGLLKLPQSVQVVEHFPASAMTRNAYGTVKVESEAPGIAYQVAFLPEQNPIATLDQPPLPIDRKSTRLNSSHRT